MSWDASLNKFLINPSNYIGMYPSSTTTVILNIIDSKDAKSVSKFEINIVKTNSPPEFYNLPSNKIRF
jgi:hypothetical protein